jgi:hypothetical protein
MVAFPASARAGITTAAKYHDGWHSTMPQEDLAFQNLVEPRLCNFTLRQITVSVDLWSGRRDSNPRDQLGKE